MRKTKNIFMNLLGAAVIAACSAGTALAQFTGDFASGGAVFNGGDADTVQAIAIDTFTAGGPYIYVAGASSNTATGRNEGVLIKYNSLGVKVASDTLSGPFKAGYETLKVMSDGSIIAGAYGGGQVIFRKYNSSFGLLVSTGFPGNDAWSIDYDASDNIYVAGGAGDDSDGWLIYKLSPGLDILTSSQTFNTPDTGDMATGIGVRSDGNILVVGIEHAADLAQWHMRVYDPTLMVLISSASYNVNLSTDSGETPELAMGAADSFYMSGNYNIGGGNKDGKIVHFASNYAVLQSSSMGASAFGAFIRPYVDNSGNVIVPALKNDVSPEFWLQKFAPNLTAISSAPVSYIGMSAVADASGYVYTAGQDDVFAENNPANDIHTIRVSFGAVAGGFTGDFTQAAGANYDGGNMDGGWAAAFYNSNVYTVGVSSPAGGFLVRYSGTGVMITSATLPGVELTGVAVNGNALYTVGTSATRMVVAKFNNSTLAFVSSKTVEGSGNPSSGADIDLCSAGYVYVIGTDHSLKSYLFAMYDPNLALQGENGFETAGDDTGSGITVDGTDVYMAGHSLIAGTTNLVLLKYSLSDSLGVLYASTTYSPVYLDAEHPGGGKIDANPVTHDIYAAANRSNTEMTLARFSQSLVQLGTQPFTSANYASAADLVVDSTGNVYMTGAYNSGASDYPVLLKYNSSLVFLSSASSVQTYGYEPAGVAIDTATGYSYVTGVYFSDGTGSEPAFDMRTVRFNPMQGAGAPAAGTFSGDFSSAGGAVYDGGSMDIPRGVAVDTFTVGGPFVYVVGTSSKGVNNEIMVIKYDSAGNKLSTATWAINGSDSVSGFVAVNPNGVYVSAQESGVGYLTIKYDADLVFVSSVSLAGDPANQAMALDNSGNVFVTGGPGNDYKTVKYSANLSYQGQASFDNSGSNDSAYDVDVDAAGNVFVTGYSILGGATDYVTIKYDNSLAFISSITFSNQPFVDPDFNNMGLTVDRANGLVYVVGTYSNAGEEDVLVLKYTTALTFLSSATYAQSFQGSKAAVGPDGTLYVLGNTQGTSGDDWLLLQYTPALAVVSTQTYATALVDSPLDLALIPGTSDQIYVTGISNDEADLGTADFVTKRFVFNSLSGSAQYPPGGFSGDFSDTVNGAVYHNPQGLESEGLAVDNVTAGGPYVYIVGAASNPVTGRNDGFVVKYNSAGVKVASATIYQAGFGYTAEAVKVGSGGNVYVTGDARNGVEPDYSVTVKYDSSLNVLASYNNSGNNMALVLDNSGNVFAGGFGFDGGYPVWQVFKYTSELTPDGSISHPAASNSTGSVHGMYADAAGNLYASGNFYNTASGKYEWLVRRYNPTLVTVVSSVTYAAGINTGLLGGEHDALGHISVLGGSGGNIYAVGPYAGAGNVDYMLRKYDADFNLLASAPYGSPEEWNDEPVSAALDLAGNLLVGGWSFDGEGYQGAALVEYNSDLVFVSSGALLAIGLGTADDANLAYAVSASSASANTYRLPLAPTVFVDTAAVTAAQYAVGSEAVALKLTPYTIVGTVPVYGLDITVNSGGAYTDIALVGLYADTNLNEVWDGGDLLLSSGVPTASSYHFAVSTPSASVDTAHESMFVTLTPAAAAGGGSVRVGVDSPSAFSVIGGIMAPQSALFPALSPLTPVQVQGAEGTFSGDFSSAGGAVYAGPNYDLGTDIARYPATGNIYVTAVSSAAGLEQAFIARYDSFGNMTASAPVVNAGGMYLLSVAVNNYGVYASGGVNDTSNFVTLRYDLNLNLVSSAVVSGVHSPRLALDTAGNVYLAGSSDADHNFHLAKYGSNLSGLVQASLDSGGADAATGIAADNGYVYVTGQSLIGGATYYVTSKFASSDLSFVSSAAYAGAYKGDTDLAQLAVNPVTHDVYLGGTTGTADDRHILTVRYSQNLQQLAAAAYNGQSNYQLGYDVAVDSSGYVYTAGKDYSGALDYPVLLKYSPNLVHVSTAVNTGIAADYVPFAVALDTATGYAYVTGGNGFDAAGDMRTLRFSPQTAQLPVIYVSTADVSPAFYLAGQEAPALMMDLYTLQGEVGLSNIRVGVNPAGSYSDIASVGLYADADSNNIWNPANDTLISSAAVISANADLPITGGIINSNPYGCFLTLTPAVSAEGNSINLRIASTAAFTTTGNMAQQAIYPVTSAPKQVNYLAAVSNLATDPGANLTYPTLRWTYPQDIASGSFIIRYSTNPADFASGPNVVDGHMVVQPVSAKTAGDTGSYPFELGAVTDGMRVYPYYFIAWLYNGTSTSTASNLAQNLYFPASSAQIGDAIISTRAAMAGSFENGARFALTPAGPYSALTFYSGDNYFMALNTPYGETRFYYVPAVQLELKALAADAAGSAYALVQKSTAVIAAKFASDGAVLWSREINPGDETAGALVYGGGALYAATEYQNGAGNNDIRIRKLSDSTGAELLAGAYDSSAFFGYGSDDEVNGLAFVTDNASNKYLYAAGASGAPAAGRLIKFADTGTLITTSTVYVPGNWPVRYSNPSGGESRAVAVKADMNGNLVVTGSEQRYDLNQGQNIWVNRYNSFGTALFAAPARYNNPQANADDVPTGLDFDQYGNIYVSAYTDMWPLSQGYNMLVAKFGSGGQVLTSRVYDSGAGSHDLGADVYVSTDNYARVAGLFGGGADFGVYSMPLGASVNTQFFNAAEGPYAGSVDLMWNYTGRLPAGSTYYIQYSLDAAPVWDKASSQITANPPAKLPGEVQQHLVGGLATLRYPGQEGTDNRGNLYKFKVWITSGGLTTELAAVQTFARTPNAYDNTQYFGAERLSFMSGLSAPPNAIKADGTYVYHAFAGRADGANAGFGLRKYRADQYLEWTRFFNHSQDRSYQVQDLTRDSAGNFYMVGAQFPVSSDASAPEIMVPGKDIWIAKLNPSGALVWSYSADASGIGLMDELYGAAIEGNYLYVVGASSTAANGMNVLARKYDITPATAPVQVWTYSVNGSGNADDFGYGVTVGTGAVYLSGTLKMSTKDMFVRALNKADGLAAGGLITADSGCDDEGYDLVITTTTPPYLYLGGSVGLLDGSACAGTDAALFKYALAGTAVWQRTFNGKDSMDDTVYAVKANDSGVIVAGYTDTGSQGENSFYRKYDFAGNAVWTRVFDFANTGDDEVYGLDLDASGRVYSAVALWDNNPGFYFFPEPSFNVAAQPNYVPGSVRLDWMSRINLAGGSAFYIQYSTFSGVVWSSASAQVRLVTDSDIYEGMSVSRAVYGLNTGRDAQGSLLGSAYYFKIWAVPQAGAPAIVSEVPAVSRPGEGWAFENISFYPNEAKLFAMGSSQQYYTAPGEKEFPGLVRGPAGNFYSVANMDWNGNGGFALKKFSTSFLPLWTMYYAPGESYGVKANRVAMDDSGIYLTGYERSPMGMTGKDVFVMKFGESGLVWKSTFNFANNDDVGYGIALDANSNVYVAGSVNTGTQDDAFLAKYSPAGVLLTTATYNGSNSGPDFAYAVTVQGLKVYAAGSSEESGKGSQLWVGGYGPNLTQVTTTTFGGDNSGDWEEAAYAVAVDTSGFVYVAGQVYNPANQSMDAVVSKSSANLASLVSSVTYNSQAGGADAAQALAIGPFGSVYAAGFTERFDINQDRNLWLRRYAQDLSELGTQEFHSNAIPGAVVYGPNSDEATSLALDVLSGYVMAGGKFGGFCGVYRYKQVSTLAVNPTLTVRVASVTATAPFPGVGVALIPFTATGIDVSGSLSSVTDSSGVVTFQVPAGKQYFIALDKQGYNPSIKDQQMDPYGNFFVTLDADLTKNYVLSPRPASTPYYPLTVFVASATAGDYLVSEVFFTQTGEKAAYGIGRVPAGVSATTVTITNVPPASAGAYTLGITIPNRALARSVLMSALFPATSSYAVSMSTSAGAISTTGGFEAGASTTPASVEGVIRSARTWAPVEQARVRLWNFQPGCNTGNCDYNVYETLSDVNGKYSFYNVVSTAAPYSLMAQKSGYKRAGDGNVFISPSSPTYYRDFQLEESTYSLRGYVRYRDIAIPNADVMIWGDYSWYGASDTYKNGMGMDTDARTKTGADGLFVFSPATLNALPDGQVRLSVSFMGNWMDLNEGNTQIWPDQFSQNIDADDVRVVISSGSSKWGNNNALIGSAGTCLPGRVWKLRATDGRCLGDGDMNFNIMPPSQNDYAALSGSVTFVTTFTVSAQNPLVISTMSPVTVMAMQECSDCTNRSMGFAVLSGTYTVNQATYSITLSTGMVYYTRVTSGEWGEISSFDDRADFRSTVTTSVRMNFVVTRSGRLKGVVKMADGSNYKPAYNVPAAQSHRLEIKVKGQNVSVSEGWGVDDYGEFDFPNLAPGLYTLTLRSEGQGFRWATPVMTDVAVAPGKTTQVTMKLENGLYVQPQIIGLPEISTPTWVYVMIPVPSGTEMNQKKITDMFFGEDIFAFDYSTATQTWDKKIMQAGQYDFYLMMGARYNPGEDNSDPESYDQFGNFIGKLKGYNVQRNDASPNLGTEAQPLQVNVLGSLGQETFEGTIAGERLYTERDLDRIISNFNELFPVIPAVMIYDSAGDLRGYTAALPTEGDFPEFWSALESKEKDPLRAYFSANLGRFMVSGLPPGRYTVVFNNPNYPPIAKEIDVPLAASYNGVYPFDFDAQQQVRVGSVYGTVRSSATGEGLADAVVYLRHRTVEKFANTAADGSFAFDNLPPGIYKVEVTRDGYVKSGQRTSLAGGDSSAVTLYMVPSQSNMTGKVYMSKFPAPVTKSGVKIVAYDETYNVLNPSDYLPKIEATTNDAGEYELTGVVPGHHYKVTAFDTGKLPSTLEVSSETVTEGTTYLPDIVMREVPPQIIVKVRRSPDSVNKVDVTIKSPKQLVTTPVCKVNPGEEYVADTAVSLALVPAPNNNYLGQFTVSSNQDYYNFHVEAGDGSNRMAKDVTYSPNNQAKTEQYVQEEAIQGGEVQMDKETEEYSGIELDTGGLAYSTYSETASQDFSNLVGGFFSALPSVRTVKTAKGSLSVTQAIQDLMASEIYNMNLDNAQANKEFTLTLKYDKEKASDNANLRIYQQDPDGNWNEVPGNYTTDPMLGVLSVGVASLSNASEGTAAASTPLGRKRFGMSAVVNGRYVPSAASTQQSGRFAVFTAKPGTGVSYTGEDYQVYNLPNPFSLKSKSVTLSADVGTSGISNPYLTSGTLIKYHLPPGKSGTVKFVIYNLAGEKVRTINDGVRAGGEIFYSEWDGKNDNNRDCASGVYFMLSYLDGDTLGAKAHKLALIK